jgi:RNA polymerase sigma-70 factor, ECF subfamily
MTRDGWELWIMQSIEAGIGLVLPVIQRLAEYQDRQGADDIVQDVAERLLRNHPSRQQLGCEAWLGKVVRNMAIDHFRRRQRESRFINHQLVVDLTGAVCEGGDPEKVRYVAAARPVDEDMSAYLSPRVRETLQRLPAEQRRALILHAAGYSYKEISEITRAKIGTVRSRVHYARKQAQALLR